MSNRDNRQISLPEDPDERANLIQSLYERGILSWRLFWDERVSIPAKLIPILSFVYFFSPIDLIPEALLAALGPVVAAGFIDDVALIVIALNFFIQVAPPDVVREHLREMGARIANQFQEPGSPQDDDVVEGEYIDRSER